MVEEGPRTELVRGPSLFCDSNENYRKRNECFSVGILSGPIFATVEGRDPGLSFSATPTGCKLEPDHTNARYARAVEVVERRWSLYGWSWAR